MPATILIFGLYSVMVAGIAYAGWRRTHNVSDYVLAGRSLSPLTAALSTGASNMSAWVMLSFPALAYAQSTRAVLMSFGLLAGLYVSVRVVAPRLRIYSEQLDDSRTLPTFLCLRTGRQGRRGALLRAICSLTMLTFMLVYVASGLLGAGKLLSNLLNIPLSSATIVGAVMVGGYTLLGGFLAICWTDVLQGLMMLVILIGLPLAMLNAPAAPTAAIDPQPLFDASLGWVAIVSALSWGLGYIGLPHSVMRFKAIRDVGDIPSYRRILLSWMVPVFIGGLAIGLAARPWYEGSSATINEDLKLKMVELFFHPWMAGLAFSAIMAAIMSTADSQLLLASVSISEDIVAPMLPEISPEQRLRISRLTVLFMTVVSLTLVLHGGGTILSLVSYAWAGLGATFGPVLLFALFWQRFSYAGAVAGVATGGLGTILFHHHPPIQGIYELMPAFALSALAIWLTGFRAPSDTVATAVFHKLEKGSVIGRDVVAIPSCQE